MLVVHINISVKPEFVEAFKAATVANARESIKEPGIARFDFTQQTDAPHQFMLVEAYRDADAPAKHRETQHYQTWRDTVTPMMGGPRTRIMSANIFPPDENW